jgi:galactose mutarotase-like enzyme
VIRLAAGAATAAVDPDAGGRLASLVLAGDERLVTEGDGPTQWGCFPMAPWAGRVREGRFHWSGVEHQLPLRLPPHAIHGTVLDRRWEVLGADEGGTTLTSPLGPDWPWPGRVVHELRLHPDRLDLRLEVHAEGDAFPASCGWHPWFRRPVELDLEAASLWQRDAAGIPTGELVPAPATTESLDDCLTGLRRPPRLRWPDGLVLDVVSDCEQVVVFTQPDHAVCVEPQTGPPDALTLAPRVVGPEPLVATASFRWAGPAST